MIEHSILNNRRTNSKYIIYIYIYIYIHTYTEREGERDSERDRDIIYMHIHFGNDVTNNEIPSNRSMFFNLITL